MNLVKISVILFLFSINIYAQNDCQDAIVVCGNSGFQGLSTRGAGNIDELTSANSCGARESNSIWLKLSVKTAGTLGFIIKPESKDLREDFDFVVFGPNAACNALGQNIRCSSTNPLAARLNDNLTGMTGDYSDLYEGPGADGNSYVKWLTVNAGDTYFIVVDRPIGSSDFSIEWIGTATFDDPPSINIPQANALDLVKSDFSGAPNPTANFDLTKNTSVIIGSQTGVEVTYHTSANDAITNVNPIIDPAAFKNTSNPQAIYVRVTNTVTHCYNSSSFNLTIDDKITFLKRTYEICDDSDTNSFDGKAKIDLNKVTAVIFDDQDTSPLTINYYLSQDDADNDINKLSNTFINTNPFQQSIFIRVFTSETSSPAQEIKIIINPLPPVNNVSLIQCDSGENANGLVLFNLKEVNSTLTNNNTDLETSFFVNNSDAINNINPLVTAYTAISNPQIVSVRITNSKTKCYSISNLTLKTNVISETTYAINPVCDDDGNEDGIHLFNLTEANIPFTATQKIKYYLTQNDALLEQNQIETPNSFQNQTPYNQIVFARIEEGNDCFGISKIKLEVIKLPDIETKATTNVCDNIPSYYTHLDAGIKNNTANDDFSYIWHKDGVEILNKRAPTLDVYSTGIYSVIVTNKNNCSKTRVIEVTSSNAATIEKIDIVDLQIDNANTITINVSGKGEYEYSLNTSNGPFQDSNVFDHINAGIHEIYVNDKKNCGTVSKTVAVLGAPHYFTPNNDGYNDYWNIIGLNTSEYKNSIIIIYDRFGTFLKQISPSGIGWDGTASGNPLPADDYWYTLKLADNREAKGHFSLKR
ncbi:T9SS type B sorting domain-containing protein [Flavobacterium sp. MC2016-06]|uniref:T9SS type B sorting domain-containing protein n=1 Tax=Flavobacterium sp. MC2016-06 TaxID=2676308 RepID=UPI0012BAC576|nr:T9SS type B sorting domain-containing protein [Flavobacterium sp. MC2016-06]MBU3861325.1 T9SS type B sorting domain-containing protein [Flavobacterium sp. MC2016-06]